MNTHQAVLMGILSIGVFFAPLTGQAQPTLEQFRFDPPGFASGTRSGGGGSRTEDFPAAWPP